MLAHPTAVPSAPVATIATDALQPGGQAIGRLEQLPKWLNLVPIIAQWLWLSLRHGSVSLPSCVNPQITSGGLVGEGKLEYTDIMGARALAACATTCAATCEGPASADEVEATMALAGIAYPVVLKPDLGWCGFGVRRVDNRAALVDYLARFPRGERIVIQRFIDDDGEAGLFYMRRPGEAHGELIGLLLRHYPRVTGDGRSSIGELIAAHPRVGRLGRDGASQPVCDTQRIPAAGETVRVSTVGSTRVGCLYEDGSGLITPALTRAVDEMARDMADFHVGRFDVKFASLAALQAGRGFRIIEVNGAGSEAVHAWDPALTLRQAYAKIFAKQRRLFEIGATMRRRGHRPIGLLPLARLYLKQQALIRRYPPSN